MKFKNYLHAMAFLMEPNCKGALIADNIFCGRLEKGLLSSIGLNLTVAQSEWLFSDSALTCKT